MTRWLEVSAAIAVLVLNGEHRVWAQASGPQIDQQVDVLMWQADSQAGAAPLVFGNASVDFVSMPIGVGGEIVTGAPYAAEAVTRVVQTLADGNRISRESKAAVYRDAAGRTRREQGLTVIGAMVGGPQDQQQVQIFDPQAGVSYVLDTRSRTAHKLPLPRVALANAPPPVPAGAETFELPVLPPPPGGQGGHGAVFFRRGLFAGSTPPAIERLGRQLVEGVEAEGTRSTITIPAGQIGNDLPLSIVSERWFSPDLKVLVLSRQMDPRFGETTYRLTNIVRGDQPADLFEPPADFTIVESGVPGTMIRRMRKQ